jgi:dolichyl-phosphate beta-glucosyltransferase
MTFTQSKELSKVCHLTSLYCHKKTEISLPRWIEPAFVLPSKKLSDEIEKGEIQGMVSACVTKDRNAVLIEKSTPDAIRVRQSDHDLTVIIPAFNEEQRLSWTLDQLSTFLENWGVDYRVLIADDGSTDGTAALTGGLGPRYSTLRIKPQGGKGRAIKRAMLSATGRVLAFTDADLPFDLAALRDGYEILMRGNRQAIFGARDLAESLHLAPRHWLRQMATRIFRAIVKTLISRQITDTQCGLKLFTRRAALDIFSRLTIDGFAFDAEVVFFTLRLGMPFERIPVTLINEYDSTLSLHRNALPMLTDVLRIWWRANFTQGQLVPQPVYLEGDSIDESKKKAA